MNKKSGLGEMSVEVSRSWWARLGFYHLTLTSTFDGLNVEVVKVGIGALSAARMRVGNRQCFGVSVRGLGDLWTPDFRARGGKDNGR